MLPRVRAHRRVLLFLLFVSHFLVPSSAWLFSFWGSSPSNEVDNTSTDTLTEWQEDDLAYLQREDLPPVPVAGSISFANKHLTPLDVQAAEAKVTSDGRKLYPACSVVSAGDTSQARQAIVRSLLL